VQERAFCFSFPSQRVTKVFAFFFRVLSILHLSSRDHDFTLTATRVSLVEINKGEDSQSVTEGKNLGFQTLRS
jgi:hypothetical protein